MLESTITPGFIYASVFPGKLGTVLILGRMKGFRCEQLWCMPGVTITELQESNETLEEQKKWLVSRVLQQEMDNSELEQAAADIQAELSERDSRIASLETEVRIPPPLTCSSGHIFVLIHLQTRYTGS